MKTESPPQNQDLFMLVQSLSKNLTVSDSSVNRGDMLKSPKYKPLFNQPSPKHL